MARRTTVSLAEFAAVYPQMKARGASDAAIARELGLSHMTVSRWKKSLSAEKAASSDAISSTREVDAASRLVEALSEQRKAVSPSFAAAERLRTAGLAGGTDQRLAALQIENELLKRLLAEHLLANALERAKAGL